jgi:hypothetical protein
MGTFGRLSVAGFSLSHPPPRQTRPPGAAPPALSSSVLGPLRIEGTRRKLRRVATREMIAYLALHPKGASRDELIEAMWPAQDPKQTRPRLGRQRPTHAPRSATPGNSTASNIASTAPRPTSTSTNSTQLLANGENEPEALDTALALWRGEPLAGSDYAWADTHIHRLHATLIGPLERAGHARLERGDLHGALELAERAIALDQIPRGVLASRTPSRTRPRTTRIPHPPLRQTHPRPRPATRATTHPRDTRHVPTATRTELTRPAYSARRSPTPSSYASSRPVTGPSSSWP